MKILDRTGLVIFSTLILIISVVMCMLIFNWMEVETVSEIISKGLKNEIASNVMLAISIIFILLAIKCIFFSSSNKEKKEYKNGILLENSDGKLLITRDTLENLVNMLNTKYNIDASLSNNDVLINKTYKITAKGIWSTDDDIVSIENSDTGELVQLSDLFEDFADKSVSLSINYDEDYGSAE